MASPVILVVLARPRPLVRGTFLRLHRDEVAVRTIGVSETRYLRQYGTGDKARRAVVNAASRSGAVAQPRFSVLR
jgi:hypothetical protein